jgi:dihydropyrimidinase
MSPPLRETADQEALWRGLAGGDLQVVATDHCPFTLADKARGRDDFSKIPNGAPGIETRLMLLWDAGVRAGRITPERFVEISAAAPAKVFGLWPRKGTIAEGSDADIVLWNPGRTVSLSASTHHMHVDYSLYEGRTVTGVPETVLSRGEIVIDRGVFVGRRGRGRFLARAASGVASG